MCRIVHDHPKRGSLGPDLAQCEIGRAHLVPNCAALEHREAVAYGLARMSAFTYRRRLWESWARNRRPSGPTDRGSRTR